MPWKVDSVSEQRRAFVHLVETQNSPVAEASRRFRISRKTGYKWLRRYREDTSARLTDESRRPRASPRRTDQLVEIQVLETRDLYGWGARKIRAYLARRGTDVPSIRTVHAILARNGRVRHPENEPRPPQFFERNKPNELWQLDHKGPLEVGRRVRHPLTIVDDHSRYLFPMKICDDLTFNTVWDHLWNVFGECGLPDGVLCDNAFGNRRHPATPTTFERDLIRLDIKPIHGRPYHPQTQGKVERLHGTFERELYPHIRRDTVEHFEADAEKWRSVYNCVRPHESLDDEPPVTRWRPSCRSRPRSIPDVEYPTGSVTRSVPRTGTIGYRGYSIAAGQGLAGHLVRVLERDHEIHVFYSWKCVRRIPVSQLRKGVRL